MPAISFACPNLSSIFRTSSPARSREVAQTIEALQIDPLVSDVAFAIYRGGRTGGPCGMEVVAHVIQNRAKHSAFPSDPQSVVVSGTEQFIYTQLTPALLQSTIEKRLFEQAWKLATQMVYPPGRLLTPDPTGGALSFDKRSPGWTHSTRPSGTGERLTWNQRHMQLSSGSSAPVSRPTSRASTAAAAPASDSGDGSFYLPPASPQPERPNRSRRRLSLLREHSKASLNLFFRRAENNATSSTSSSSQQLASSSSSDAASVPARAGRGSLDPSRQPDLPRGDSVPAREVVGPFTPPPTPPPSSPRDPIWFPSPSPALHRALHPGTGFSSRLLVRPNSRTGRNTLPVSLPPSLSRQGHGNHDGCEDMILPCGLFQDEIIELMYRDLSPEDFDMLCKLDERLPKRNIVQRNSIDVLPRVHAKDCGVTECRVCLSEIEGTTPLVQLPCHHAFHPACISKWLTQCKNTCPLCSVPIALPAGDVSKDSLAPQKGDAAPTPARHQRSAHREVLGPPRQEEPRSRPPNEQGRVHSLHL